ncbi:MAG: sulfurtransferase, partial [Gammaproteobacteria bacterium]
MLLVLVLISAPAWSDRSFLVDSDWLSEHIEDENLVVL